MSVKRNRCDSLDMDLGCEDERSVVSQKRRTLRCEESMDTEESPMSSSAEMQEEKEDSNDMKRSESSSECDENSMREINRRLLFSSKETKNEAGSSTLAAIKRPSSHAESDPCPLSSEVQIMMQNHLDHMMASENDYRRYTPDAKFLKYRSTLVEWLMDLCKDIKCRRVVLSTSVRYMDRILQTTRVVKENLQLVAICCFLIAAKYEGPEELVPSMSEAAYLTGSTYDAATIRDVEVHMLMRLKWNLQEFTPYHFMRHFFSRGLLITSNERPRQSGLLRCWRKLSNHILASCLREYAFERFRPSILAMSVLVHLRRESNMSTSHRDLSRMFGLEITSQTNISLEECVKELKTFLREKEGDRASIEKILSEYRARNDVSPRGISDLWSEDADSRIRGPLSPIDS
eukprot:g3135.t1